MAKHTHFVAFAHARQAAINANALERDALQAKYGQVWDTHELFRDFEVKGFLTPYAVVRRKADDVVGVLMFQHSPRLYFAFTPDSRG